ncbi:sensor histidine kinase [Mycolicibacterium fortuitum]|uniref:histidine kinase n=1 Tax=Mycolicibacterium fortuitum subsp. fortuitum DSM 46621 = ATCC 6841 = JCM 6387 TaxID=1214102 RepID=K0USZ6_MYCFO|nr:HAMP domain-containing sensor histidine kinase [Mycolicibacterium fortuitum]AIY47718.1 sensor histidine kinase [Mycobacterium sp. VKM Ac-1817D]CRL79397.1 sensor histidine kinase [Mycolicibacter nonchromogenicus]EJZ10272.1 sensor histidine kinase [Mycolicibacterium fortuitum subsp. fortuitum DSM 46621 = ATCC 6841 = JCM 6387]WEV31263.1 HAMP domain-containing histidine kinase [Mycolicibacterium fortuitum]CRL53939.1 sensor histidine kinase [Mycolicibacterium fortuitum subsp. fortuitum DSM 46621
MSCGPRAEVTAGTASSARWWAPRTWSLRARLVVTQVALLAVVCASIGVATEFALQRFLMNQLDDQLIEAGRRSAAIFELPPPPPGTPPPPGMHRHHRFPFDPEDGPGPGFLNAPGQAARTVGAVVAPNRPVDAGVITADGDRVEVSATAATQLSQVSATREPETVDLDGLGRYRLIGLHPRHGGSQTIVTGLPTAVVDDTLLWVLGMFCVLAAIALIAATTAGILILRRQLAPLSRVSAAARRVADLELDRGEVELPTPIVPVDPATAHTEVGQLGTSLNRMLDRIASALSARHASETRVRQFVADASHELRTPLAAIRGYTELAQRKHDELPADVAHAMNRVESETTRMTQLVEDMLLLARLDAGRPLERESVDLSRLVVDSVSDAHIAGPDHQWSLDLPEDPVVVDGDEARLHQVLANLLANARTHTPSGTSVTVALKPEPDAVLLSVADDGPGIPASLLPDVFERFARGDSSRSRREGSTGLGLAIVAAVVKAHGGTIDVSSTAGSTEFVVRLPQLSSQGTHRMDQSGT